MPKNYEDKFTIRTNFRSTSINNKIPIKRKFIFLNLWRIAVYNLKIRSYN